MRVAFLGNAAWSVPSLAALAGSRHEVVLAVTRAPRPAGRGSVPTATPVAAAARELGVPLAEVETVKRGPGFEQLAAASPDALAVVAYGEIVPQAVLGLPSVAPVNVHFSLLPALRGAAPVQRAILEGMEATGVTTMRMDAGMDTGPILLQAREPIVPDDDGGSLGARLAEIGGRLLVRTLDGLEAGTVEERPQDERLATHAPKITPEDERIDWHEPAERVLRRVRALSPEPGAWTRLRGRRLKVFRARRWQNPTVPLQFGDRGLAEPGRLMPHHLGLGVWTGSGPEFGSSFVLLDEVQPEGRRRMTGAEFARGYRPVSGERLG